VVEARNSIQVKVEQGRSTERERQIDRQTDREHALKTIFFFLCGCVRESNNFAGKSSRDRKKEERKKVAAAAATNPVPCPIKYPKFIVEP